MALQSQAMPRLVATLCMAFSLAACATHHVPGVGWTPPSPVDPVRSAIYHARLDSVEQEPGRYWAVCSTTATLCEEGCWLGGWHHRLPSDSPYYPLLLVLVRENIESPRIDLENTPTIKIFTDQQFAQGFGRKHSWERFLKRFPGAGATVQFSRPAISPDGRKALLYAGVVVNDGLGGGELILLAREGSVWRIVETVPTWIS